MLVDKTCACAFVRECVVNNIIDSVWRFAFSPPIIASVIFSKNIP